MALDEAEGQVLYQEAVSRFGAQCLWNVNPKPDRSGLSQIAERLRQNGGMDAWELASRIRKHCGIRADRLADGVSLTLPLDIKNPAVVSAIRSVASSAGRKRVQDHVEMLQAHRSVLPLWHAAWAAPALEPTWSPLSLLEWIARSSGFRDEELEDAPFSAHDLGRGIREAVDEARYLIDRLPDQHAGRLFCTKPSGILIDIKKILRGS